MKNVLRHGREKKKVTWYRAGRVRDTSSHPRSTIPAAVRRPPSRIRELRAAIYPFCSRPSRLACGGGPSPLRLIPIAARPHLLRRPSSSSRCSSRLRPSARASTCLRPSAPVSIFSSRAVRAICAAWLPSAPSAPPGHHPPPPAMGHSHCSSSLRVDSSSSRAFLPVCRPVVLSAARLRLVPITGLCGCSPLPHRRSSARR